ncbi:cholesterol 7-alpha-monooxygenase [Staphylotrichum tortipilum]|uniref:Cholesterol 7-alpha-monooxygenase n=1 Tax=Staphylotrichum tortipilum TaxID=2831512 RepID=A0AAN6RP59_9PEZI|nr:cholesterol 7-alpha-monooxygenase [Staphylotrichum longicolle]
MRLPIYTLRLPFQRIYVVNSTALIPPLQRQWRYVSFGAIVIDAGSAVGMSKEGLAICVAELARLRAHGNTPTRVGLREWSRKMMVDSTAEAVWGPQNPYRDPVVAEAWKTFEAGFLTLAMSPFPRLMQPKLYRAREVAAKAMTAYILAGAYKTASGLVRRRFEHHHDLFHLSFEDIARGKLGNTFAVLGNSAPCALWLLYQIFSSPTILTSVRAEPSALVTHPDAHTATLDLAAVKSSSPILLSTFQETLRFRAVNPGPRVLLDDVALPDGTLLKKGAMLMIPAPVQHTDTSAWGDDAAAARRTNRVAFRAFGGGHVLCPGRHFASMEILALAALTVLQFNVVPVAEGEWREPTWERSPVQAGIPVVDEEIEVELRPREIGREGKVVFSGSGGEVMGIVEEDVMAGGKGAMGIVEDVKVGGGDIRD